MRPRKTDRHLPACVYLKHGAYWLVKGGKWTRLGSDLQSALAVYARTLKQPTGIMPRLIDATLANPQEPLAKNTIIQYTQLAGRLKEIFFEFSPESVTSSDIVELRDSMTKTPNMANRMLSFLSLVFDRAIQQKLIASNPCTGVKRFKEARRKRLLSEAEFDAIYANAGERLQVILDLLYQTGQRPMDVLNLRRSAIREEGIYFRQAKTGSELIVGWTPELRAVVERAKAIEGNVSALVFLLRGNRDKAPNYFSVLKQWGDARIAAKVENAQLRDIRAMAITQTKAQGDDPQAIAGHKNAAMTERYLRGIQPIPVVRGPRRTVKTG